MTLRAGYAATVALVILSLTGAASAAGTSPSTHRASSADAVPSVQIRAEFRPEARATYYSVVNSGTAGGLRVDLAKARYIWHLLPPENDRGCDNWRITFGTGKRFVWHHGNKGDPVSDDGCNHAVVGENGHPGRVLVTVEDENWRCSAAYFGTEGDNREPVGFGDDEACTGTLLPAPPPPPPPPPPPSPTAPDCSGQKAALEGARAAKKAAQKAYDDAYAAYRRASAQFDAAGDRLTSAGQIVKSAVTLGLSDMLNGTFDDWLATRKAWVLAFDLLDALRARNDAAGKAVDRAHKALNACLHRNARRLQVRTPAAACGPQQTALARRQGSLSVYRAVARSFARVPLPAAVRKLRHAQQLMTSAKAKLPSSADAAKLATWLDEGAATIGRAAVALEGFAAVGKRLAAKVKPAEQQVVRAKRALADCKKK